MVFFIAVVIVQFLVKTSVADCPALTPPVNGWLAPNCGTRVGNVCRIHCRNDCLLVGDRIRKCRPDNTWSGSPTVCIDKKIHCPRLNPPTNGYQIGSCRSRVGCICRFACNPGFTLSGSPKVVCQRTGQWSPSPTCVSTTTTTTTTFCPTDTTTDTQNSQLYCPSLDVPTNGLLVGSCGVSPPNSVCRFSCNPGYQLVGNSARVCQKDGSWTNQDVTCSPLTVTCPSLKPPRHGYLYGYCAPGSSGKQCQAVCNSGYSLVGTSSLTCQSNGAWSAPVPICVRN